MSHVSGQRISDSARLLGGLPGQRLYAASRALPGLSPFIYANRAHCKDLSVLRQAPLIARSWARVANAVRGYPSSALSHILLHNVSRT